MNVLGRILDHHDRLLVLGSSGWFGRELQALMVGFEGSLLPVPGPSSGAEIDLRELVEFRPTVVINFAYLTRERVTDLGPDAYEAANLALTNRFLELASLSSVSIAMTVSSGAAVTEPESLYGRLKLDEEAAALQLTSADRSVVVVRAYSVSGGYVRRPRAYAFSDLILQAREGLIRIDAKRYVMRRYCAVRDLMYVSLISARFGRSGILESGGHLVEIGELAEYVRECVNPSATIQRTLLEPNHVSSYHSDNESWMDWMRQLHFSELDIASQITSTNRIFTERGL